MRWAFVADHNATGLFGLALAFALEQHLYAPLQQCNFCILACNNVGQVINGADEMGKTFL